MSKKLLVITGLITLMIAQSNAQSVSLGPQIGYYKARDADKGSIMGGAAWRLKVMPIFGVEASINYRQEKYGNDALTVRSWPVMLTGLFFPLPVVYGAVGAGWYSVTFDYNQNKLPFVKDETTQKVGWHFGGGVELPVGSSFKLTGDIRYVFLNYKFKQFPGSSDMKSNFTVVTVGFLYNL
jgi:opacity protein-like surface antigen